MKRKECLDQASEIVHHDRNSEYGEPEDNFGDIASYWTAFLRKKLKTQVWISSSDVAIMSVLIKVSRIQNTPGHEDSWRDIAGYAACGAECATELPPRYIYEGDFIIEMPPNEGKKSESLPARMVCGCPLTIKNLVERGADLCCANCGWHYAKKEI